MVATDQEKQKKFLDGILAKLSEEDTQRKLGQAAANFASQGMGQPMMPVQYGGGLLQMMPTPTMQAGQGIMSINPDSGSTREEKMANMMSLLKMLGMG